MVRRVGARRQDLLRGRGRVREVEPSELRPELEDADARRDRREGLPYSLHAGTGGVYRPPAEGVPSRLVVFPDENHWVLKPKNSIQWYSEVFGWMDRWMGK